MSPVLMTVWSLALLEMEDSPENDALVQSDKDQVKNESILGTREYHSSEAGEGRGHPGDSVGVTGT